MLDLGISLGWIIFLGVLLSATRMQTHSTVQFSLFIRLCLFLAAVERVQYFSKKKLVL